MRVVIIVDLVVVDFCLNRHVNLQMVIGAVHDAFLVLGVNQRVLFPLLPHLDGLVSRVASIEYK